jgi:sulfur carrier protein ThiS
VLSLRTWKQESIRVILRSENMKVILPDRAVRMFPAEPVILERLLLDLGFVPSGVIVIKNGRIVPEDTTAAGDDLVRIVRIAHGG